MWDFMKEREIIQWFFLFLYEQNLYASFGGREKRGKKRQNFHVFQKHLDLSVLIYCTLQELRGKVGDIFSQWGVLNGITVEYSGEWCSLQLVERCCFCLRGKAACSSSSLGIFLLWNISFDPGFMKIYLIALQRVSCRAIYNSQNNSVMTSLCSHKTVFPSASGDESAVVITRVREILEKTSVPSTLAVKNEASKWFLHGTFFLSPGHQVDGVY